MKTNDKNRRKYPESMLTKLEGDIIVLVGHTTNPEIMRSIPQMNFRDIDRTKRGIIVNPEGYSCAAMCIYNDNYNLVCNCQVTVRNGFRGIIATNSSFVVEAVQLYSRMYGVSTRFFLAENGSSTIVEHTDNLEPIYAHIARFIKKLDKDKATLEKIVEDAGDRAKAIVEKTLDKNPTLADKVLAAVRDAVNGTLETKPSEEPSNSIEISPQDVVRIVCDNIVFDHSSGGQPSLMNLPVAIYDDTYHNSNDIRLVAYADENKVFVPAEVFMNNTWSVDKLGNGRVMLRCWKGYPSTVYWEGTLYTNFASIDGIVDKLKDKCKTIKN